jgi:hypothetical protein
MGHLAGRVSTEEASAKCPCIRARSQLFGADCDGMPLPIVARISLAIMPILAKETVQGAASIKDRQVVFSKLSVAIANPICHAIRREWIAIPVQQASVRSPRKLVESAVSIDAQATVATLAFSKLAAI